MEWQVIFRNLYTGFLLRDFAGKIIPGVFLLFSIAIMFRSPRELIQGLRKDVPIFAIIFVAGLSWTVTLGTQSLAEGLGIWHYFPIESASPASATSQMGFWSNMFYGGDETKFNKDTSQIDRFQVGASEDQKQQYERFVVIKEACGNLFVAGLLAAPAWLCAFFVHRHPDKRRSEGKFSIHRVRSVSAPAMGIVYFCLILLGLHRMNAQHVRRQFNYTTIIMENRNGQPKPPVVVNQAGSK